MVNGRSDRPPQGRGHATPRTDWNAVRQRLSRLAAAFHDVGEGGEDRARRILEERARRLAEPVPEPERTPRLQAIVFELAKERYALEAAYLHGVFRITELARLPAAAAPAFGVAVWRGDLLLVVDLRGELGLPAAEPTEQSRAIVLGRRHPEFGVLADAVSELAAIPPAAVVEPPAGLLARRDYVRGTTARGLVVLDAPVLLRQHG